MNQPPATKAPQDKKPKAKKQSSGPNSRLKPLLAILLVVLVGAGVFLFLNKGDDDQVASVAGSTVERSTTTAAASTPAPTDTPTTAAEAPPSTVAGPSAPAPTAPPSTPTQPSASALTPTQERALCHMAFVGQAEGKTDTGDPLDTCTPGDWMTVGLEVSIYLHGDPNQDRAAMLRAECDARRSAGVTPKACTGI